MQQLKETIMPILIGVNGALGVMMAALYYPHSPFYLFGTVELFEVWLWAKYSAFLGAILLVFILLAIDSDLKGRSLARSLSIFVMSLNSMLQLPAIALYFIFLRGVSSLVIDIHGQSIKISMSLLFLHLVVLILASFSATWLALVIKNDQIEIESTSSSEQSYDDLANAQAS